MNKARDRHGLSDEEWRCLEAYAQDRQDIPASLETLARLEQLGLLMRGWNHSHYLTARGEAFLRGDTPPP